MKNQKTVTLFMMLDHMIVDSLVLDYTDLTTCTERQKYQDASAQIMLVKHKRKIDEFNTKPTFFVRDKSSMSEKIVELPDDTPKNYFLSEYDKEYIRKHCMERSVKQIAAELEIKTGAIYHYLHNNNLSCKRTHFLELPVNEKEEPKIKFERPKAEYSNRSAMGIASGHN